MDSYKITFETWDKVAQLYEDNFMNLTIYDESYDLFCQQLSFKYPSVFEIGCGPGNITKYLLQKRPDFEIEAIDISKNMIALAQKNNPNAIFSIMDSRDIHLLKRKFDAVVCGFCIPYLSIADVSKLVFDCKNLLFEHGCIYLSFVEGDYHNSGYKTSSSGYQAYFYYHSIESVLNELQKNGFKIIKQLYAIFDRKNGITEKHTILIALKK